MESVSYVATSGAICFWGREGIDSPMNYSNGPAWPDIHKQTVTAFISSQLLTVVKLNLISAQ